jgi:hypothetical protein
MGVPFDQLSPRLQEQIRGQIGGQTTITGRAGNQNAGNRLPCDKGEPPESDLHYKILEYCKSRRWLCFHSSMAHKTRSTLGMPDFIIAADRSRVFFIECKSAKGKLSPQQLGIKLMAEKLGHQVDVCRSFREFLAVVGD